MSLPDRPIYFVTGACYGCGGLVSFDPARVPSIENHPLCLECVVLANGVRREAGLECWNDDPSIYEPVVGFPE